MSVDIDSFGSKFRSHVGLYQPDGCSWPISGQRMIGDTEVVFERHEDEWVVDVIKHMDDGTKVYTHGYSSDNQHQMVAVYLNRVVTLECGSE